MSQNLFSFLSVCSKGRSIYQRGRRGDLSGRIRDSKKDFANNGVEYGMMFFQHLSRQ